MGQWQSRDVMQKEFVLEVLAMSHEQREAAVMNAQKASARDAYLFGHLGLIVTNQTYGKTNELIAKAFIQAPSIEFLKRTKVLDAIIRLIRSSSLYSQQRPLLDILLQYTEEEWEPSLTYDRILDVEFLEHIMSNLINKNDADHFCQWIISLPWSGRLLDIICRVATKFFLRVNAQDRSSSRQTFSQVGHFISKIRPTKVASAFPSSTQKEQREHQELLRRYSASEPATKNRHKEYQLREFDKLYQLHAIDKSAPWYVNPLLLPTDHSNNYGLVDAHTKHKKQVTDLYLRSPVHGYDIKSVRLVFNERLTSLFSGRVKMLERRSANSAFTPQWMHEMKRRNVIELFNSLCYSYDGAPHVSLIPLWHGTNPKNLESIFTTGFANLATTDSGFFGKGIYGTPEAEYAHRVYSTGALLVNWVAVFSPFPVLFEDEEGLAEKANFGNYDAHFVPVCSPNHPHAKSYHACKSDEPHQYSELVVFDSAQVLPQFIVELQPSLIPNPPLLLPPTTSEQSTEPINNTCISSDPPSQTTTSTAAVSVSDSSSSNSLSSAPTTSDRVPIPSSTPLASTVVSDVTPLVQ